MPRLECGAHLVDFLWQVGPAMPGGVGPVPITFSELQAWQQQTGCALGSWEVRTLRRMSVAYVAQAEDSRRRDCPPPWIPPAMVRDRADTAKRVRALFRN